MDTKVDVKEFRVRSGKKFDLKSCDTSVKPVYSSKESYEKILSEHVTQLSSLQQLLYASDRYALLIIFQAMDAAGKDGAIAHVMSGVNPQGCQVYSFKQPTPTELQHDFLWRTYQCLPERGRIGIFNRSYYEEVLVVRVHPEYLVGEGLTPEAGKDKGLWQKRYQSIVDMEDHLYRNNTRIVKFFLHLSRDEQRRRFLARIDDPKKNWKFSDADVAERKYWDDYMDAYEACIRATSTDESPWYVVPADDKKNARLIVSSAILETLKALPMSYPSTDEARHTQLEAIRKALVK